MNKNYYFSLSLLMVLMTVLALVACHDDDEVKADQSYTSCPDNNHPHLIDLGLPSRNGHVATWVRLPPKSMGCIMHGVKRG